MMSRPASYCSGVTRRPIVFLIAQKITNELANAAPKAAPMPSTWAPSWWKLPVYQRPPSPTAFSFASVFAVSYGVFWAIKKTIGLRVSAEEEEAGLDIVEHGMYGYPEQFIPVPERPGAPPFSGAPAAAPVMRAATPAPSES